MLQYLKMLVSISLQVIMEAVKWLSASTAVNLMERPKVVAMKHCHIFSANEGQELKCIED